MSLLKKKIRVSTQLSPVLLPVDAHGQFLVESIAILDRRMVKKHNAALVEVLVQ